ANKYFFEHLYFLLVIRKTCAISDLTRWVYPARYQPVLHLAEHEINQYGQQGHWYHTRQEHVEFVQIDPGKNQFPQASTADQESQRSCANIDGNRRAYSGKYHK